MSITLSLEDKQDKNSLKVPSISSFDGRLMSNERFPSISSEIGYPGLPNSLNSRSQKHLIPGQICLSRPVSDQNINAKVKNRKEKAVSWHSKIPMSTQTLGCVEHDANNTDNDDIHAQSQPLLGTLESKSNNKHLCRHTYSVRVHSQSKEARKGWNLKRSMSTGNEKSKVKDKFLQQFTERHENESSTLTPDVPSASSGFFDSKIDLVENSKSDEYSLIDWEEDEKICDAEVCNITGQVEDDDDATPIANKPFLMCSNWKDEDADIKPEKEREIDKEQSNDSVFFDGIEGTISNHSKCDITDNEQCEPAEACDQTNENYAHVDTTTDKHIVSKPPDDTDRAKTFFAQQKSPPTHSLSIPCVQLPEDLPSKGLLTASHDSHSKLLFEEKRPPLRADRPTEESHL